MKRKKRETINLSLAERKEYVDSIDQALRADPKASVYNVCKKMGLKQHHYYNWTKQVALKGKPSDFPIVKNPPKFIRPGFVKKPIQQSAKDVVKERPKFAVLLTDDPQSLRDAFPEWF